MNTTFAHRWPAYLLLGHPINDFSRRCHAVFWGALCCVMCWSVSAAEYPLKSVRLIVPLAAAGGTDISARILAKKLSETMGQSFVVDNRPGAGTMLGTEMVAKSAPDGYTLMVILQNLRLIRACRRTSRTTRSRISRRLFASSMDNTSSPRAVRLPHRR